MGVVLTYFQSKVIYFSEMRQSLWTPFTEETKLHILGQLAQNRSQQQELEYIIADELENIITAFTHLVSQSPDA